MLSHAWSLVVYHHFPVFVVLYARRRSITSCASVFPAIQRGLHYLNIDRRISLVDRFRRAQRDILSFREEWHWKTAPQGGHAQS